MKAAATKTREVALLDALGRSSGERIIHSYLKKHPNLLWGAFMNCGGHSDYVIPEFRIGSRFRCDFVVMQSYSGGWNIEFVELEPVNVSLFNKDRTPSKPLRIALKQIDDWKRFLETDGATMRSQLADAAKKNDLLQPDLNLGKEPTSFAGDDLRHPFTHIHAAYNVVIGRRDELDDVSNHVRNSYRSLHMVQICTYDRFVQVARNADRNDWLTRRGAA